MCSLALTEVVHREAVLELDDSPVGGVRDGDAAAQAALPRDGGHLKETNETIKESTHVDEFTQINYVKCGVQL